MWVGYWKRTALLFTLTLAPIYLSLSPDRSIVPCSFRLGSGATWLVLPNQRFTVKALGILARRGTMGAVSPLRRPADRRTTWLTSSWSRTGVAEPRMLLQEATPTLQLASLGGTGAAAQGNHSDVRLTSSWRRTGVAAAETPELNANSSNFSLFSNSPEVATGGSPLLFTSNSVQTTLGTTSAGSPLVSPLLFPKKWPAGGSPLLFHNMK